MVPDGLSVGGQSIGGLDTEEARQKIEDYAADISAQTVILDVDGTLLETTVEGLGFNGGKLSPLRGHRGTAVPSGRAGGRPLCGGAEGHLPPLPGQLQPEAH